MAKRKAVQTTVALKLSERAMLASLHIGMWSGMMTDREVSEEVSENHKAGSDAGRYSKKLIAPRFLSHVGTKINVARRSHKILTLPWDDDGTRILSATGYLHYTEVMNDIKQATKAAASEFVKMYPDCIEEARSRLGTMFNRDDFPPAGEVAAKFYIDVEIKPFPEAKDFRARLSNDAVEAIARDIEDRSNQRIENAMKDIYRRVADVTRAMADKLREYEPASGEEGDTATGVFRDTLVTNVAELAGLIPSLNVTGDPKLDALAQQLQNELVENSAPEVLRTDTKVRKKTIDAAERIFKKVSTFLA